MFLAYLDSSGGATFNDLENYVLSAVMSNEINWQYIDNGIKAVKLKHFPHLPDSEVEIHAMDMMKHRGIYKGLKWEDIFAILADVFNFISDDKTELCLISVLIDKAKLRKDKDIETWAYRLLFERVNKFIEKRNKNLILARGAPQYGMTIIDSCGLKADQRLRKKLFSMLRNGTLYSNLEYLIEDPLFTDSKWRNLSQIADCVAYCVRRRFRTSRNAFRDLYWESFYEKIKKKFDVNKYGQYRGYGLKIFP